MSAGTEAPPSAPESVTQNLVRRTGVVADVLGVAGGVAAFLNGEFDLVALSILAVLLISASWFWRKRTAIAVALLVTGCVVVGCVGTLAVGRWLQPDKATPTITAGTATTAPVTVSTTAARAEQPTPAEATGTGSTSADNVRQPIVVTDQTVALTRGAAVDVDTADSPPAENHADGATGDYDLFHEVDPIRSDTIQPASGPNAYIFPGANPGDAYFSCKDVMSTATPYMMLDSDFCFRTSAGRVAHAVVTRERSDHAFVLHVVVWDDPA